MYTLPVPASTYQCYAAAAAGPSMLLSAAPATTPASRPVADSTPRLYAPSMADTPASASDQGCLPANVFLQSSDISYFPSPMAAGQSSSAMCAGSWASRGLIRGLWSRSLVRSRLVGGRECWVVWSELCVCGGSRRERLWRRGEPRLLRLRLLRYHRY